MFGKKSKEIKDLKMQNEVLLSVINSLEEDLKAIREEAYKTAKKPTTRKKAK